MLASEYWSANSCVTLYESWSVADDWSSTVEAVGERVGERRVHLIGLGGRGLGVVVLEQVAGVLREHLHFAALEGGEVGVALADLEVARDREAGLLERLRVDLGDDLVRVVGLRADDDGCLCRRPDPSPEPSPLLEPHPARVNATPTATAVKASRPLFLAVNIMFFLFIVWWEFPPPHAPPDWRDAELSAARSGRAVGDDAVDDVGRDAEQRVEQQGERDDDDRGAEHLLVAAQRDALQDVVAERRRG